MAGTIAVLSCALKSMVCYGILIRLDVVLLKQTELKYEWKIFLREITKKNLKTSIIVQSTF